MMMDIRNIDLQALDKEGLEQVKLMLDISKIQADIEMTRQSITASQQSIALTQTLNQATIEKMRQDADESRATVEQMRLANDKYLAETAKLRKEMAWFPYLQIITTLLTGGLVVFLLTKLLQ